MLELDPAAVLVGNGPGDPAQLDLTGRNRARPARARAALRDLPGHQLVGLALGLETFKLPVRPSRRQPPRPRHRLEAVLVTAQNHGFAVAPGDAAEVSHVSLNDGTVEGLARGDGFETLQFHPEAAPGPHDAVPFFDRIADACRSARISIAS